MYLVINKCVTDVKVSNFSGNYLLNRSTLDIGVLGYIGIVQHKEHSPEVLSIPPGTPVYICINTHILWAQRFLFTLWQIVVLFLSIIFGVGRHTFLRIVTCDVPVVH